MYHCCHTNEVVFVTLSKVTGHGNCKGWILRGTLCFMPWIIHRKYVSSPIKKETDTEVQTRDA